MRRTLATKLLRPRSSDLVHGNKYFTSKNWFMGDFWKRVQKCQFWEKYTFFDFFDGSKLIIYQCRENCLQTPKCDFKGRNQSEYFENSQNHRFLLKSEALKMQGFWTFRRCSVLCAGQKSLANNSHDNGSQ